MLKRVCNTAAVNSDPAASRISPMYLSIVLMLLGAAVLHSSWHAMIKVGADRLAGLAGMNVVSATVAVFALPFVETPNAAVWRVLILSVVLHNAYKLALAQVYRHGALGQAYPLARGFSPLFATLIAIVALSEMPSGWQTTGILLTSSGILAMGLEQQGPKPTLPLLIAAAATGFTVASYTVIDAYGSRLSNDWLSFTVWLMVLDGAAFVGVVSLVRGRRLWVTITHEWGRTLISGLLGIAAFAVFLWALSQGPIGGVSALRETSVLFTSLIGVVILKEGWSMARFAGAALITVGIVIFAILA